ncbi:MAG: four helix bundle protein [Flavobacteriales bacterium]|nr:four helix bundle protein [Flavobacteriales bacterium]
MSDSDLKARAKKFFFSVLKILKRRNKDVISVEIIRQLVRSSGSVSANSRAMFRARSRKEYFAKLGIVIEESDECVLWLEALLEYNSPYSKEIKDLMDEANQLTAIFVSLYKRR